MFLVAPPPEPVFSAKHWACMPRKLKVYQTSQGFYDLAIAAPSMKAALEAWGTARNLFHQGFARESGDAATIDAAMAKPGVVLRRPVGTNKPFSVHSELPSAATLAPPRHRAKQNPSKVKATDHQKIDEKSERRAAAALEKEQQRRARERRKEEAAAAKKLERRKKAMEKAEAALQGARQEHEKRAAAIEKDLAAIRRRADEEEERCSRRTSGLPPARPHPPCRSHAKTGATPFRQSSQSASLPAQVVPHLETYRQLLPLRLLGHHLPPHSWGYIGATKPRA
jgi:colicin import membrane protein